MRGPLGVDRQPLALRDCLFHPPGPVPELVSVNRLLLKYNIRPAGPYVQHGTIFRRLDRSGRGLSGRCPASLGQWRRPTKRGQGKWRDPRSFRHAKIRSAVDRNETMAPAASCGSAGAWEPSLPARGELASTAVLRSSLVQTLAAGAIDGTVKLSGILGFWRRKRSSVERRINNLGAKARKYSVNPSLRRPHQI